MDFQLELITDKMTKDLKIKTRIAVRGIIWDGEKLLLVKTNCGDYKFPGGGIEPGETEQEALLREIAEETGYVDIEMEELAGTTFEQNLDTEDSDTMFQMKSVYYKCKLLSKKRVPEILENYEEKLGFRPCFITVPEAYHENVSFLQKGLATPNEIPWLERETKVLEILKNADFKTQQARCLSKK